MQTSLLRSSTIRQLTSRRFASTATQSASQAASQTASKAQDVAKQAGAKAQDAAKAAASKLMSAASGLGNSLGKIGGRTGQLIKGAECEHWFSISYILFFRSVDKWSSGSGKANQLNDTCLPTSLAIGHQHMKLD